MRLHLAPLAPAVLLVLGLGLAACDDEDTEDTEDTIDTVDTSVDTEDTEDTDTADTDGHPRFVHLSGDLAAGCDHDADTATPDAMACLDLYIKGSTTPLNTTPFPFGASTAYPLAFPAATYTFQLHSVGADPTTATPAFEPTITLEASKWDTLIVYGRQTTDPSTLSSVVVRDDPTPPTAGTSRVRVFHAALAGATAAVDLSLDTTKVGDDVTFGSMGAGVEVTAGTGVTVSLDTGNDGTADFVGQMDVVALDITDLFIIDTGVTAAPFMLLAHTNATNTPVQVLLGPATR